MSYSLSARAKTKAEVKAQCGTRFDEIVAAQPVHAGDLVTVRKTVDAFIDLLKEGDNTAIQVSVSGSVTWVKPEGAFEGEPTYSAANVTINAYNVPAGDTFAAP